MATIKQMIADVVDLKRQSEDMSQMIAAAGKDMSEGAKRLMAIAQESKSGQDAARALSSAAGALEQAANSMIALGRTCDECINDLRK